LQAQCAATSRGSILKSSSREVKQLSHAIADSLISSGDPSGLVYVEEHERLPGLTRKRSGQNFVYLNAEGVVVRDREIVTRIEALAIPPAWAKVWICPVVNGHLQATGRDAKGRKQYLYHAEWRTQRTLPNSNICWNLAWSYLDYGGWLIGTCGSVR
jgi:DNA topoisomerase IB